MEELAKMSVSLYPEGEIVINPRDKHDIELRFHPQTRINSFKKEISYSIAENEEVHKLLYIQGSCHGMELKLMEDTLGFASVVVGSKLTKSIQLNNLGDIGAKFHWDTTFCNTLFSITPEKGFLPANDSMYFDVSFHPNVIDNCRFAIKCMVENSTPLNLTLLGRGVQQSTEAVQEIKFETIVRTAVKNKIVIKNPTQKAWRIKANITTTLDAWRGFFTGKEMLDVPVNGQVEYEVTYEPLSMTTNENCPKIKVEYHEATLFFPLPDGTALMYNLKGKSNPPNPLASLDLNIKAKKDHIQIIKVKNWLKQRQRFAVSWLFEGDQPGVIVNGANTIDISEDGTKDYKLNIYGLKQATAKFTVTFKNEKSDDYVFCKLNVNVTPADAIETIELASVVREFSSKVISIENPLLTNVEIKKENFVIENDNVNITPQNFTIHPKAVIYQ